MDDAQEAGRAEEVRSKKPLVVNLEQFLRRLGGPHVPITSADGRVGRGDQSEDAIPDLSRSARVVEEERLAVPRALGVAREVHERVGDVADGRVTTYHYDALDRLASTTLPDGTSTSQTYDAENRRATSTDAAGNTTLYTYDAGGRLTRTTFADGTSQSAGYDDAGRAVQTIDALGYVTWTAYDLAGRLATTTGAVTRYHYDDAGNRTRVTDAPGHATTFTHDDDNRVVATTYADGTADATIYDAAGRAVIKIDTLDHRRPRRAS